MLKEKVNNESKEILWKTIEFSEHGKCRETIMGREVLVMEAVC
jgi:hypothetical protein